MSNWRKTLNGRLRPLAPYLSVAGVGVAGVLASLFAFATVRHAEQAQVQSRFNALSQDRIVNLRGTISHDLLALNNLDSAFAVAPDLSESLFHTLTDRILLAYPSIQAVEWAPRVPAAAVGNLRAGNRPLAVTQKDAGGRMVLASPRPDYYPVLYVTPYRGNEKAYGYDLGSEPNRREALQRAMDTGLPTVTAGLHLVQGRLSQTGVLYFIPVYRGAAVPERVASRRANLLGFVVGVYAIDKLLDAAEQRISPVGLDMAIRDGATPTGPQLLGAYPTRLRRLRPRPPGRFPPLVATQTIVVGGRIWAISAASTPWFYRPHEFMGSYLVLFSGLAFSLLAVIYLFKFKQSELRRQTAVRTVSESQSQLLESEQRYKSLFDYNPEAVFSMDNRGHVTSVNHAAEVLTGYSLDELRALPLRRIFNAAAARQVMRHFRAAAEGRIQHFEVSGIHKSGRPFEAHVINLPIVVQGAITGVYGIARDITQRKQQEQDLRLSASALANTVEGVMITDARQRILSVNKAFTTITGYGAQHAIGQHVSFLRADPGNPDVRTVAAAVDSIGYWQGEVWYRGKQGDTFPVLLSISAVTDNAHAVTHHIAVFNDVSAHKEYEQKLEYLAHHDPLTGLPNRLLLLDRGEETIHRTHRHGQTFALMLIDLDHFKTVNDTLGHVAGDALLVEAAGRLRRCVREMDLVARLGGDEFTVLLGELANPQDAALAARKIIEALAAPYTVAGHTLTVSASIGISCYPSDGLDMNTLLKHADIALYQAKSHGRNHHQFFSEKMNARALERLVMINNLREGLEKDEFVLFYQPVVDLRDGRIVGAEALVRWLHPRYGLLEPNRFIGLAEETGLINQLGAFVLRTACRQLKEWQMAGYPLASVAVNISARQFLQTELVDDIETAFNGAGLAPGALKLEVTESMVMHNPEETRRILGALRARGYSISIDDFGTGYSSLSYLKFFPIDYLKIDRSFVHDIPFNRKDMALTRSIIGMAQNLDMRVIAEGIETQAQSDFLREAACDEGQGYYFGKPLPAGDFEALVERQRALGAVRP